MGDALMPIDVSRFIRVKSAAQAAAERESGALAGKALVETYNQLQHQIRATLPEGLHEEFDSLFPKLKVPTLSRFNLTESAAAGDGAKTKLTTLAGWLQGILDAEARAGK